MHFALICSLALLPSADEKKKPVYPEPGSDIPGTFHTWNVTGKKKGFFHSPVVQHGLNPVVMILIKGLDDNANLVPFLKAIDTRVIHNRVTRLAAFVVFYKTPPEGENDEETYKDLVKDDRAKEKNEVTIQRIQNAAMLQEVILTLSTKSEIKKYLKEKDPAVTVVIYSNLETVNVHSFTLKDNFKQDAIIKDLEAKIGASRTEE